MRMAEALAAYSLRDVAPEAAAKAKLCVLDLLSSAFSARDLPWAEQAAALARSSSLGVAKGAGILGSNDVVSIQDAAFANGVIGHGLVRDERGQEVGAARARALSQR